MLKDFLRSTTLCSAILSTTLLTAASQPKPFNRPLVFEPNQGQVSSQVSWTAQGAGYRFYMTPAGGSIVLAEPAPAPSSLPKTPPSVNPSESSLSVVRMKLNGGNPWTNVQGLEPTGGVSNYLIGNDRKAWHTGIPHYERLRVARVYEGIDLVLYGRGRDLEYDFVVAPGADPNEIRVSFEGAKGMRIDKKTGDLVVTTATGAELRQLRPNVYQQFGNQRVEVAGEYRILKNGQAGFSLGGYDPHRSLVIDPTVSVTIFLTGDGDDEATGIAVDAAGNSYVTGLTNSANFPVTNGYTRPIKNCFVVDGSTVCPPSIFVTKLSPYGQVLASTIIGGSNVDLANGIAVDDSGVFITGTTTSPDFTTNPTYAYGNSNAFVAKLTPDLSAVYWCVTFGGVENGLFSNVGNAIALDSSHAAYVAGDTNSVDFPTTKYFNFTLEPKQKAWGGGRDAFVVKVDPWGYLNLGYSTYLGGSGDDRATGIAVDGFGYAYVTGVTGSTDFPTNGAPQLGSPFGGGTTAFVTKLLPDGSGSVYSLYLGGTMDVTHPAPADRGNAIAVNATQEVYLTGSTCSSNFPVTYAAAQKIPLTSCSSTQQVFDQNPSAFVAKLSNQGTLLFATYLGGSGGYAIPHGIAINNSQEVYVAGETSTSNMFPMAPQIALNPTAGFLTKFTPSLSAVDSTTFLGASISAVVARQPRPRTIVAPVQSTTLYTAGQRLGPAVNGQTNVDAFMVKLNDPAVVVSAPVVKSPIVSRQSAMSVQ